MIILRSSWVFVTLPQSSGAFVGYVKLGVFCDIYHTNALLEMTCQHQSESTLSTLYTANPQRLLCFSNFKIFPLPSTLLLSKKPKKIPDKNQNPFLLNSTTPILCWVSLSLSLQWPQLLLQGQSQPTKPRQKPLTPNTSSTSPQSQPSIQ